MPDPGILVAGAAVLCSIMACLREMDAAMLALVIGVAFLAISRFSFKKFWPRIKAVNIFILFAWLVVPWSAPGQPFSSLPWLTEQGVFLCGLITLKANAILCVFTALLTPLSTQQWGNALASLRCPESLGWLIILMRGNISILIRQWHIIHNSALLRGFVPKTSLRAYKVIAMLLGHFFLVTYDKAHILENALALRGGIGPLPFARGLSKPRADILFCAAIIFCCLLLLFPGSIWQ